MIPLTSQERLVLICLCAVISTGSALTICFDLLPQSRAAIESINDGGLVPKTDVNRAGVGELTALPFIGEYTARKIIEYRNKHGDFRSLGEISLIPGVRKDLFDKFISYLKVGPL